MSRTTLRAALAATILGLVWVSVDLTGQVAGQPSTKNGDWPAYTADIRGSRPRRTVSGRTTRLT